jgi:hypothetical protein
MNEKIDKRIFAEAILDTRFWMRNSLRRALFIIWYQESSIQHLHAETASTFNPWHLRQS